MLFVPMMCCFLQFAAPERRAAGYVAAMFAGMYAAIILLVCFTQLTTARFGGLTEQARILLDFRQMNLFFSFYLLGYALMSLATFFAGLTVCPRSRTDRWLRALLLIHGVFFISCLLMPMLGVFRADSPAWIGTAVLEFWCAYFCPVACSVARVLSEDKLKNLPPKGGALWGKCFSVHHRPLIARRRTRRRCRGRCASR